MSDILDGINGILGAVGGYGSTDYSTGGLTYSGAGPDPYLVPLNDGGSSVGSTLGNVGTALLNNGLNIAGQLGLFAENAYGQKLAGQISSSTGVPLATGTGATIPTWVYIGGAVALSVVVLVVVLRR